MEGLKPSSALEMNNTTQRTATRLNLFHRRPTSMGNDRKWKILVRSTWRNCLGRISQWGVCPRVANDRCKWFTAGTFWYKEDLISLASLPRQQESGRSTAWTPDLHGNGHDALRGSLTFMTPMLMLIRNGYANKQSLLRRPANDVQHITHARCNVMISA